MDELEISGKRYISTRRAGKEHKYHADYIGQLIRGGKVAGQKVGRAWYVDAESLATYLNSEQKEEGHTVSAPAIEEVPESVIVESISEIPVEIEKKIEIVPESSEEPVAMVAKIKVEEKKEETIADKETYKIPIAKIKEEKKPIGLQYIQDDAEILPSLQKNPSFISVMPRKQEVIVAAAPTVRAKRKAPTGRLLLVLSAAGVLFFALATLTGFVVSTSIVTQGQAASVHYSLKPYWESL